MREIAPGLWHWTARRESIGAEVSSYYLDREHVLIDPMIPPEGLEWFDGHGAPEHAVLTNRHHDRDVWHLREAYRRLLELDFDLLLLAHGNPVVGGAPDALRAFLDDAG